MRTYYRDVAARATEKYPPRVFADIEHDLSENRAPSHFRVRFSISISRRTVMHLSSDFAVSVLFRFNLYLYASSLSPTRCRERADDDRIKRANADSMSPTLHVSSPIPNSPSRFGIKDYLRDIYQAL